ncbi:MAG: hypothetical protein AAGI53_06065 [Planctomycetota bacterium]
MSGAGRCLGWVSRVVVVAVALPVVSGCAFFAPAPTPGETSFAVYQGTGETSGGTFGDGRKKINLWGDHNPRVPVEYVRVAIASPKIGASADPGIAGLETEALLRVIEEVTASASSKYQRFVHVEDPSEAAIVVVPRLDLLQRYEDVVARIGSGSQAYDLTKDNFRARMTLEFRRSDGGIFQSATATSNLIATSGATEFETQGQTSESSGSASGNRRGTARSLGSSDLNTLIAGATQGAFISSLDALDSSLWDIAPDRATGRRLVRHKFASRAKESISPEVLIILDRVVDAVGKLSLDGEDTFDLEEAILFLRDPHQTQAGAVRLLEIEALDVSPAGAGSWRIEYLHEILARGAPPVAVHFKATGGEDARVRYKKVFSKETPRRTSGLTDNARAKMPRGYYYIWTERDGQPTSDVEAEFEIMPFTEMPVEIEEIGRD